jgi:hypothetical protein
VADPNVDPAYDPQYWDRSWAPQHQNGMGPDLPAAGSTAGNQGGGLPPWMVIGDDGYAHVMSPSDGVFAGADRGTSADFFIATPPSVQTNPAGSAPTTPLTPVDSEEQGEEEAASDPPPGGGAPNLT